MTRYVIVKYSISSSVHTQVVSLSIITKIDRCYNNQINGPIAKNFLLQKNDILFGIFSAPGI